MPEDHFQRLLRCLDLEAEAEARELARQARSGTGDVAERSGRTLVGLAIREEESGFGGRAVLTLGKRDRRIELPWTRLNSGTPVVLSEEQVSDSGVWRGVVTERDRETITVVLAQSPEPIGDRPTFRLDLSSDEIARDRQRAALKRAASADSGRLAVLKRKLLGEEVPTFALTRSVSEGERSTDGDRESSVPSPSLMLRVSESGWQPLNRLDDSQREAVSHALAAEDFAIIHGPPGTGKTTTVVELIRQAVRRGDKVLACAPSNLAVDNLLERLLAAGEKVIRIGHPARVLPELREHTLDVQVASHPDLKLAREWKKQAWALRRDASKYKRTAPEPGARREQRDEAKRLLADARKLEERLVEHLLDSADIVCATLTGLDDELLGDRKFDLAVIDEAAQATEPPCWIPLLRANRLVLAGDHCQLPPTIVSPEASNLGFGVSLMERLLQRSSVADRSSVAPATEIPDVASSANATRHRRSNDVRNASRGATSPTIATQLTTQYRMHEQIMRFSSAEFYNSTLVAADLVREHLLADLPHVTAGPLTQSPLRFFDTAGSSCEERAEVDGSSRDNPGEAEFVARQVAELLATGLAATEIAVITPYAAQARLLRQLIAEPAVEIDTVDGFQGREKEAVVISLVRSNSTGELGFLTDTRRLNVALTRARRKLVVFGDSSTLANHEFFIRLLNFYEHEDVYGTIWELS